MSDQKDQVAELLKAIETGASEPISVIDPEKYIQHNLGAADGMKGFGELLAALPPGSARVNTVRVFQDGDYVFAHTDYNFFGPKIGFDIFRFENGQIVEHWDNLQDTPDGLNPSGHSMVDGWTTIADRDRTDANKQLVAAFVDDILVNGRTDLQRYFDGDRYIQHNPNIADGLSGFGEARAVMASQGILTRHKTVHHVLGEGNFVLTTSEGTVGDRPSSFYNLFRVEDGRIAEHWDTIEAIPPRSEWKNENGKF